MTNINIRIPDDLHKEIKLEAVKQDISLKDFIISCLEKEVGRKGNG